ncbi:hypothetical protein OQA88_10038 [Cercophora sp. LCS_1]
MFPEHNVHVSLTARSNYKILSQNGVRMKTHTFGDYVFRPENVFPNVEAAAEEREWDYVVVTTKALPDRDDEAGRIEKVVTKDKTAILLIQNGVGVEGVYRERFGNTPVVSGVTVVSAELVGGGEVVQRRWTRLHLGPYGDGFGGLPELAEAGAARANEIGDWWARLGGIRDVEVSGEIDLQMIRWHKLCINAAFNPSAVLAGGRGNADMVLDPVLREHLAGVMTEIWEAVPRILGREFPDELAKPEKILKSTERNVGSKPSMLLDWEAGRPLELEVILGNPVRIAKAKGVEMPRLQTLYALLRSAQWVREGRKEKGRL